MQVSFVSSKKDTCVGKDETNQSKALNVPGSRNISALEKTSVNRGCSSGMRLLRTRNGSDLATSAFNSHFNSLFTFFKSYQLSF